MSRCLNLLDSGHSASLQEAYRLVRHRYESAVEPLPRNTAAGAHFLDREVIDTYCRLVEEVTTTPYQTVRGCFPEGDPVYPGSRLLAQTHVQLAVRDVA